MKTRIVSLGIALLLVSLAGLAQQPDSGAQIKQVSPIPVTKGYYAIGNNAQKLNMGQPVEMVPSETLYPPVKKGYYAIGDNSKKAAGHILILHKGRNLPEVKKGYYSIGNNKEKLQ